MSQRALDRDNSTTRIQIFGVEHPEDAFAVAAAGANHLGFCPAEDPALAGFQPCIAASDARALFSELPDQTATVLLFATAHEDLVLRTTEVTGPDFVQVCWAVDSLGPEREAREAALEAAERYATCADLLILDTHADREWIGATGLVHDWRISAEIVRSTSIPCILAGGLDAGNLRRALEAVQPWGVDSYSRTNLPDLRKDLDKVRAFVEVARRFDAERNSRTR